MLIIYIFPSISYKEGQKADILRHILNSAAVAADHHTLGTFLWDLCILWFCLCCRTKMMLLHDGTGLFNSSLWGMYVIIFWILLEKAVFVFKGGEVQYVFKTTLRYIVFSVRARSEHGCFCMEKYCSSGSNSSSSLTHTGSKCEDGDEETHKLLFSFAHCLHYSCFVLC